MSICSGRVIYSIQRGRRCTMTTVDFGQSTETDDLKILLENVSVEGGSRVKLTLEAKKDIELAECALNSDEELNVFQSVLLNGYQTWSGCCETTLQGSEGSLAHPLKPLIGVYGDYQFYSYRYDRLHGWTYTTIRDKFMRDTIKFYGSLNEQAGFTAFEYNKKQMTLRAVKDCRGLCLKAESSYKAFDLISLKGAEDWAFDRYFELMGTPKPRVEPCTGWTSWYQYYTAVTQQNVLDNLSSYRLNHMGADYFQIDDGYQQAVGDWLLINEKFPAGMAHLAGEIHKAGMKAGLWLAPIVCEKKSRLYQEHPDWVAAKAGFNPGWSGVFYCLDFYNEGVRAYLREVFDTVLNRWGYDMVKLDFLYAAALPPRRDKTRGQVMDEFMCFLREICGDKVILGCGVPLASAFGKVDYCRVGGDVSLKWEDGLLNACGYHERVSTANAISGSVYRRHLNGRAFLNDPDVFILRDGVELTKDQKYTLFMINSVFGGLIFTSDTIGSYDTKNMTLFGCLKEAKGAQIRSFDNRGALKVEYMNSAGDFCLIANLTEDTACAYSPCAGVLTHCGSLADGQEAIHKGQMLLLRPYQSICLQTGPVRTDDIESEE